MSRMSFFPTPYPDELFYSVLCRYHMRCGNPAVGVTNREMGMYKVGQNVYLPQVIGNLAAIFSPETNLTAEFFTNETTIFPFISPFMPEQQRKSVISLLKDNAAKSSAYKTSGFSRLEIAKWKCLRYCEKCWQDDIRVYGEAYWHRIHILPGLVICPVHGTLIQDSEVLISNIGRQFSPASFELAGSTKAETYFSDETRKNLHALSQDGAWLLKNGYSLPPLEDTLQKYAAILGTKGFLNLNKTKTKSDELDRAIRLFYGNDVLNTFGISSDETIPWSSRIFYRKNGISSPLWHLLLIRFLAGSASTFFTEQYQNPQPYGAGPWPCKNPVCEQYSHDVIAEIDIIYDQLRFKADFECPHCGFVYRRSNGGRLDEQTLSSSRFMIVDYGWKWEETLSQYLKDGMPVMKIMELMHCGFRTVMSFGVQKGFFTEDRVPKNYHYSRKKEKPKFPAARSDLQAKYRKQLQSAISSNPSISRSWLQSHYSAAYHWLKKNDPQWCEENLPKPRRYGSDWAAKDKIYCEQVKEAISSLLESPGKPIWITLRILERRIGYLALAQNISLGHLPLTKEYLDEHLETRSDWNKRKIRWAAGMIYESGKRPYPSSVRLMAGLTTKTFNLFREYANDYISQLLEINND